MCIFIIDIVTINLTFIIISNSNKSFTFAIIVFACYYNLLAVLNFELFEFI